MTRQTILRWRLVLGQRDPHLLPPIRKLSDLVTELVLRLKTEWPAWGTRRIAGQLAHLGVVASRSSVQRILRRSRPPTPEDRHLPTSISALLAKRPNHIWMIDFTRLRGGIRPVFAGAVIDVYSRKVLAVGVVSPAPNARLGVRLLRMAIQRYGRPTWLVSDQDPAIRNKLVNRLLRRHGIRRRYGAVGKKGSIGVIERLWRSMKHEYVRHLFLYRPMGALESRLRRWCRWHNAERPHQGLGQQTPDDIYRHRPPRPTRNLTGGTLHVRFFDGDRRLPVLRLDDAA